MGDDEEEPVDTGFGLKPVTWGEGEKWYGLDKAIGVSYECTWGGPGGQQTTHRAASEQIREDRVSSDLLQ